jgi:hypothetical protein
LFDDGPNPVDGGLDAEAFFDTCDRGHAADLA